MKLAAASEDCTQLSSRLERVSPVWAINNQRQRLDDLSQRAGMAWQNRMQYLQVERKGWQQRLMGLNPYSVLQRGYAIVSKIDGQVIHSQTQVALQTELKIQVADGKFKARVTETASGEER
jgi:exodeoxyribonuclease VII large subunit